MSKVLKYNGKAPKPKWMSKFKKGDFLNENGRNTRNINKAWVFKSSPESYFWNWEREKSYFDVVEVEILIREKSAQKQANS